MQARVHNVRVGIIVANLFITLDGVYQAPGGREEDPEGEFAFGGCRRRCPTTRPAPR